MYTYFLLHSWYTKYFIINNRIKFMYINSRSDKIRSVIEISSIFAILFQGVMYNVTSSKKNIKQILIIMMMVTDIYCLEYLQTLYNLYVSQHFYSFIYCIIIKSMNSLINNLETNSVIFIDFFIINTNDCIS